MQNYTCMAWTTKQGPRVVKFPAKEEGGKEKVQVYVTLCIKKFDPNNSDAFMPVEFRFHNGDAQTIINHLEKGTSRRLLINRSDLNVFEKDVKFVLVKDASGKKIEKPTSVEHVVDRFLFDVWSYEFVDPKPGDKEAMKELAEVEMVDILETVPVVEGAVTTVLSVIPNTAQEEDGEPNF